SVMFGVIGGIHYYFWARLVRDMALPPPWRMVATAVIVALGVALPLLMLLYRMLPARLVELAAWPAYLWMGFMMLLFLCLVGADVVRLMARVGGVDPERRAALQQIL